MNTSNFKPKIRLEGQTLLLTGILIFLILFFGITEKGFLTGRSISSMAIQLPEIGILSLAMMIPVMIGGINLSINATANLAAVLSGLFILRFMPNSQGAVVVVTMIGISILIGVVTGMINGLLVAHVKVPPILATLATMSIFTGIGVGLTKGQTVTGFPESLGSVASLKPVGIPMPFLVFIGVTIVSYILLGHTTFGFKTRMLGTNSTASKFSGINNKSIIMQIFIFSGVLSSIAGVLIMSRTMSASNAYGTATYVMLTILIGVLAGVISGKGSVLNIFITVLILQIISTGSHMLLAGVRGSSFFKDFAWGVLLIIIFIINYFSHGRKKE
jgi:simple sugar transport system permease protein